MRVLLVGNVNSIWIKSYIENILIKIKHVEIFVLTFENSIENFQEFYNQYKNKITIFEGKAKNRLDKTKKIMKWCKSIAKDKKFDYMHIHSLPIPIVSFLLYRICGKYAKETILTYYGSDLFRCSWVKRLICKFLLRKAKYVTMATYKMIEKFNELYNGKYITKIRKIAFGIESLHSIDKFSKNIESVNCCKSQYGIPIDKKSIAIGYNGSKKQNHIAVIRELGNLTMNELKKFFVVIQLSYGLESEEYRGQIVKELEAIGVEYCIIDKYLNKDEIAALRVATDIVIHAQPADAFSASIQEIVYAGNILINPQWIEYKEFDETGVKYYQYSEINDIHKIIMKCNISDEEKAFNKLMIKEMSSWEINSEKWLDLYKVC